MKIPTRINMFSTKLPNLNALARKGHYYCASCGKKVKTHHYTGHCASCRAKGF